ncbi:hypothetical protein DI09_7p380 [Mitosporidium daphniae]|uniref:SH3 domain-containing protein n=1 Tax=Mitosporidium daphniae TaxID=1485682 RepID=A0A098VN80_9MICR|nr:uncharacterized protein DI09_7p380 [Mitosporidium daphniae]KGG50259.1 hypothetical protein DI09_7p380 [Mitosporidium daphniae]|eukprot:XP_013236686.1 uncharacterized protein DI09_7p380 [Mitosporidium daphniae]
MAFHFAKDCGYVCHFKCQPKILDYCGRVTNSSITSNSSSKKKLGSTAHFPVNTNELNSYHDLKGKAVKAKFAFASDDPEEVSISLSDVLLIVDGVLDNGWIKVPLQPR